MQNLSVMEAIYWGSTIIGGSLFLFRLVSFFIAGDFGDHEFELDTDFDADFDMDVDSDGHHGEHDLGGSLKLLSLQTLTAFFMMFGLTGLALLKSGVAELLTILGGAAAGTFTMWVIAKIFQLMLNLQSDGTLRIVNAIGQEGSVYLTIPKGGSGQVRVSVQGALKIFDAVSEKNEKIPTGGRVRVSNVINENTLVVNKVE